MMLAPLAAWAVDTVPDRQKGLLGGLLAFAPATGALAGVAVTMPGLAGADARVALVAAMVAASVLPALLLGRPVAISPRARIDTDVSVSKGLQRRTLVSLWLARTAVQTAEGTLFAVMLFYFRAGFPGFGDADVARIFSVVLIVAAPIALAAGRWVDRHDRKVAPLIISAALAALGLATMASAGSLAPTIAGYVLFGLAATVFLALHSSQTMRVLPNDARRARDLGIFNLANTLPSLWVPSLALMIVPQFGYAPLIWLLSGLTLSASLLLAGFARTPTR
jgi:hypothetical protein